MRPHLRYKGELNPNGSGIMFPRHTSRQPRKVYFVVYRFWIGGHSKYPNVYTQVLKGMFSIICSLLTQKKTKDV